MEPAEKGVSYLVFQLPLQMLDLLETVKLFLKDSIYLWLVLQIKDNLDWIKLSTWSSWFKHQQQRQSRRLYQLDLTTWASSPPTPLTVTFPVPEIEWCVLLYGETLPSIALTYAYQTCLSVYIHYTHHGSHSRLEVPFHKHTGASVPWISVFRVFMIIIRYSSIL